MYMVNVEETDLITACNITDLFDVARNVLILVKSYSMLYIFLFVTFVFR